MGLYLAAVLLSGFLSWVVFAEKAPTARTDTVQNFATVSWTRTDLRELAVRSDAVILGEVERVREAPPITAGMAGAPPDTPPLQRERVSMKVLREVWGDVPDTQIDIIHAILPGNVRTAEDPPYRLGSKAVLFLERHAEIAGAWNVVSVDGRLPVLADGTLKGLLSDGPAKMINDRWAQIAQVITDYRREAKP